jgi:hypothetical protein
VLHAPLVLLLIPCGQQNQQQCLTCTYARVSFGGTAFANATMLRVPCKRRDTQ